MTIENIRMGRFSRSRDPRKGETKKVPAGQIA